MSFDIELTAPSKNLKVGAWRTSDPIVPSLGYGGHPVGARPKKKALTVWEGRQPFQIEVPLVLYLGPTEIVEGLRSTLDAMATSRSQGWIDEQPPAVKIKSNRGRLPLPADISDDANWWIEDLKWGEELRRASDGELVRKQVNVTLLERIDDELFNASSSTTTTSRGRNYTVKKGDTLHSIAARELGSAKLWWEITQLNEPLRSDGHLKPGMVLHLPPKGVQLPIRVTGSTVQPSSA
jgi:LysM repeat protein